jgi:hypothetical protein
VAYQACPTGAPEDFEYAAESVREAAQHLPQKKMAAKQKTAWHFQCTGR